MVNKLEHLLISQRSKRKHTASTCTVVSAMAKPILNIKALRVTFLNVGSHG